MKVLERDHVLALRAERHFPVVEIFGPTIQGEGPDAGRRCFFVRFGGCDYRCSWCDSLHAVLPEEVRKAERLPAEEIVARLRVLGAAPGDLIVLSGGNPALLNLDEFVKLAADWRLSVETQGTRFKPWMDGIFRIVLSPKPPSSGMETDWDVLDDVVGKCWGATKTVLKVVVGDQVDYAYAMKVRERYPHVPFYLSALNPAGSSERDFDIGAVLENFRDLCELVAADPALRNVTVLPQLHTLAWGAAKGV